MPIQHTQTETIARQILDTMKDDDLAWMTREMLADYIIRDEDFRTEMTIVLRNMLEDWTQVAEEDKAYKQKLEALVSASEEAHEIA